MLTALACSGSTPPTEPEGPPPPPDLTTLRAAMAAHTSSPSPQTLRALSEAAGAVQHAPIGDLTVDHVLGDALCNHLLRPDLGLERLEAHADAWTRETGKAWLDCVLRSGDGVRFAEEVQRLEGHPIDPHVDGFRAAVLQSRAHREMDWRAAVRAHDAGALADAQHPRGRRLDRPLADLSLAVDVFQASFPKDRIHAVVTRSATAERDDPMRDAGVIPVVGGRRRVLAYGSGRDELAALVATVDADPPVRTLGLAIEAVASDGRSRMRLCAEGRIEEGQLWLLTACDETRELTWSEATEHAAGAIAAGLSREAAVGEAAARLRTGLGLE